MEEDRRRFSVARRMVRQGQQTFRKDLFKAYEGHCAVTGFDTNEVLQAAHILDYRGTQSNIVENDILLRSDIHLLFDSYLLGINPASMRRRQVRGFRTGSTQISMARSCFCLKRKPCVRTRISLSRNINVLSVAFDPDRAPRHSS
ncbi:HNH endonuclease [Senegalimassilia anaerobia]